MKVGVGQDDLDARRGLVAEGHAEIDHDPLAGVRRAEAVEIEVHADLVRPAERQEDELVVRGSVLIAAAQAWDCGGRFRAGRGW